MTETMQAELPEPVTRLHGIVDEMPELSRHQRPHEFRAIVQDMAERPYSESEKTRLTFEKHEDHIGQEYEVVLLETTNEELLKNGKTLFIKLSVHTNEVAAHGTTLALIQAFREDPSLMEACGIARVVVLDANAEGVEMNGDELFSEDFSTVGQLMRAAYRGDQVDWVYPMAYEDYAFEDFDSHRYPGTSASMDVLARYKPDLLFVGHNACTRPGPFYGLSHEDEVLNSQLTQLAEVCGVPLYGEEGVEPNRQLGTGIFTGSGLRDMYEGCIRIGIDPHTYLVGLGGNSRDWMRATLGDAAMGVIAEVPYLKTQPAEELSAKEARALSDMRKSLIDNGLRVLENISQSYKLDIEAQAFYDAAYPILTRFAEDAKQEAVTYETTTTEELFYIGVPINSVRRLAYLLGMDEEGKGLDSLLEQIIEVQETLSPEHVTPRTMVKIQLGAIALASLAIKEGRISEENNVMGEDKAVTVNNTKWL